MERGAEYHPASARARRLCPRCAGEPDRFGRCERGHPALRLSETTYEYVDFRDNLIVDRDAPVLAWRQAHGHRLGHENSHEALAWNVFRSLELAGLVDAIARVLLGPSAAHAAFYYWKRSREGAPHATFAEARAALEQHLRGPDVHGGEADLLVVDAGERRVALVGAHLAQPLLAAHPPGWFASARGLGAQRRRRAVLEAMTHEEDAAHLPFRRGLDDAVRRGAWPLARRLLLARAVARRLGDGWRGGVISVANPPTVRDLEAHAARFEGLLAPSEASAGVHRVVTWTALWEAIPAAQRPVALERYLRDLTASRAPAHVL